MLTSSRHAGRKFLCPLRCFHTTLVEHNFFSITKEWRGNTQAELHKENNLPEPNELQVPSTKSKDIHVIYNCRRNIDARPRKLNLLAKQIRHLPVSEAIKQMQFSAKQAAKNIKEVLIECQDKAKVEHGITDVTTLWVAESYVGRGFIEKKIIRHGRGRLGAGRKAFTHYFVVVKEGLPKVKQQRRTDEDKTEFDKHFDFNPRIIDSHAWW